MGFITVSVPIIINALSPQKFDLSVKLEEVSNYYYKKGEQKDTID